jgi:ASC-1-like (ASCH) protein
MSLSTSSVSLRGLSESGERVTLRKTLQNPPESPWFDWMEQGVKRFEGRLRKDDWARLQPGDLIEFVNANTQKVLLTRVLALPSFGSFADAFKELGRELVPVPGVDAADVACIYRQYYPDEEVQQYGVVAVHIEVLRTGESE